MVVEEVQRFIGGNTRQPERELGEFHGERIHVHAENAGFDNAPPPVGNFGLLLRRAGGDGNFFVFLNLLTRAALLAVGDNFLRHGLRCRMINDLLRQPFRGADKEMAAAHCRVNEVQSQDGESKTVVALLFVRLGLERRFDFRSFFNFVNQRLQGFADEIADNPVRRVKDSVPVVLAVRVSQFEPALVIDFKNCAEQSLVNVAKLPDFKQAVVNRLVSKNLLLARGASCGRLRENELAQDVGERLVTDTPCFNSRMQLRIEQPAIVPGDFTLLVLLRLVAVNQPEQLDQILVKLREGPAGETVFVAQRFDEPGERKLFAVAFL
ncbi:MAG: hypothetical protein ABSC03_02950 [Verrucomicrobiota bacterium]